MASDPVRELRERISVIEEVAGRTYGTNDIEPMLYDLLRFLRSHPESRADFEAVLIELLDRDPLGAFEIIGFTMHDLRWGRIKQHVEIVRDRPVEPSPIRAEMRRSNYDRLLTAFEDDWDDTDLFEYYQNPEMFE